ncbi:MAG: hypothetical protein WD845_01510, partial [Pirellulales bacterium]
MRNCLLIAGALALLASLPARCQAQSPVTVEAVRGEPFGVGRLTLGSGGDFRVNVPRPNGAARRGGRIADLARRLADKAGIQGDTTSLENTEMSLVERSGRIFYPVFEKRDRPILREFIDVPKQVTVHFLFVGDGPLDLTLFTPAPQADS